jgi:hypothetical protein
MSKSTILISIKTNIDTTPKVFGRSFIQTLCSENDRFTPELLSTTERYKDPFKSIENFLDNWWAIPVEMRFNGQFITDRSQGPSWGRRKALVSRGMVNHGFVNQKGKHIPSSLWFESRWEKAVDFEHLFDSWVELSQPEIGMLHLFTDAEKDILKSPEGMAFSVGGLGGPAKPGISNIGWAMAYGESHAAEVNVPRIEEAGFAVKTVGNTTIVQVTESLADIVDDFAYFSKRRAELKRLFRPDLFWVKDEPKLDC